MRDALGSGALKAALRGDWMGHALHPLPTDTVIGTWTSGLLLDLPRGQGADRLVAAGIICAVPTALSGATDWADAEDRDPGARRVGALHPVANIPALGLQIRSLSARRRGARARGIALSLAANGLLGAGGYLGGHLSDAQRVGVGVGRRAGCRCICDRRQHAPASLTRSPRANRHGARYASGHFARRCRALRHPPRNPAGRARGACVAVGWAPACVPCLRRTLAEPLGQTE